MDEKKKKRITIIILTIIVTILCIIFLILGIHYLDSNDSSFKVEDKVEENTDTEEKEQEENTNLEKETPKTEELSNEICDITGNIMDCIKEDSEGNKYINIDYKDMAAFYKLDEMQCEAMGGDNDGELCSLYPKVIIKNFILDGKEVELYQTYHTGVSMEFTINGNEYNCGNPLEYFIFEDKYFVIYTHSFGAGNAGYYESLIFIDNEGTEAYSLHYITKYTLKDNTISYEGITKEIYEKFIKCSNEDEDSLYPIEASGTIVYEDGNFTKENVEYLDITKEECPLEE